MAATTEACVLGEGPVWDGPRNRLLWVDIEAGIVHEGVLEGLTIRPTRSHTFDQMVGAVVVADDGSLMVAAQETLMRIGPEGARRPGRRIVPVGSHRRCNDAAVDPAGRLLVGTLSLAGESVTEQLLRLDARGALTVIDDDLTLSNGLAWSTDGSVFYSVDSRRGVINRRSYDPVDGAMGERRVHIEVLDGEPDGITIDAEDHLWVAVWGAGEVRRFSPKGTEVARLPLPAPQPTSVTFAGGDLRTMVITTARTGLSDDQLARYPHSGRIFVTRAAVPGLPAHTWAGGSPR